MLIEHLGKAPEVHEEAWVAPDATLCGEVRIGAGSRIMHGARVVAETGSIEIGASCIVMENAVIRATGGHDCSIGDHVLIGPNAHVVGSRVENEVFLATGTALFHGSRVGRNSVVRVNAVVHLHSVLPPGTTVPIGWIACGRPAGLYSPDQHDELWRVQKPLNFALTAYGIDRPLTESMREVAQTVSTRLAAHRDDRAVG
jgi:carbonic anhydrase/acetyltransferase-like protein (isoleucine patch superfamily)